jgi:cyclophilin family peptidyl-prolyl cis-trans isomerase
MNRRTTWPGGLLLLSGLAWLVTGSAHAQTDGIFAEFNTSMGSFTCRLDHVVAPKAVASFIGLATGEQAWLDLPTGLARTNPFFHGLTFHRVIPGFVIQGGSPNGVGTDGPGYTFVDEFDLSARHNSFGTLSMANSGPDSNGSQFFLTVASTPGLDDKHTVFGKLTGGSNVVYAISQVARDANDKPLTNVVIQQVNIRRVGAAAQAFNLHAQGLASVTNVPLAIGRAGSDISLTFSNQLAADNRIHGSSNLVQWTGTKLGIEVANPLVNTLLTVPSSPQRFYRMAQVQYPGPLFVPKTMHNRNLTLQFAASFGILQIAFNSSGGGIYSQNGGPLGTLSYAWIQDAYRGRLRPISFSGIMPMDLHLDFDSPTNGTFKGTAYLSYPSIPSGTVSGTFAASP